MIDYTETLYGRFTEAGRRAQMAVDVVLVEHLVIVRLVDWIEKERESVAGEGLPCLPPAAA